MSPEAWESALVIMFVQFGPFDGHAVRFEHSANVARLAKKFACHMDCGIP